MSGWFKNDDEQFGPPCQWNGCGSHGGHGPDGTYCWLHGMSAKDGIEHHKVGPGKLDKHVPLGIWSGDTYLVIE